MGRAICKNSGNKPYSMFSCIAQEAQDAMNHASFEDEEAQIDAVFKEAIRLKNRCKELTLELTRKEHLLATKDIEVGDIVQEKNQTIELLQVCIIFATIMLYDNIC